MLDKEKITNLLFKVLHKKQDKIEEGSLNMDSFTDKNTKLELAKALIEKLIGIECVETGDVNCSSVEELNRLRTEVYRYNEDVIDELVNAYRYAYLSADTVGEGE